MSLFNIKLKTKAGNDVKKKQTFTVFFRLNYKSGLKNVAEYTFRIIHPAGIIDNQKVLELKVAKDVKNIEDLTLKVVLNFCHLIGLVSKKYDITPDFVMFISPDLNVDKNKAWTFLSDCFKRPKVEKNKKGDFNPKNYLDPEEFNSWLKESDEKFEEHWTQKRCSKMGLKLEELELLKSFVDINPNTTFISLDPMRDPFKYKKSIHICDMLLDRINRNIGTVSEDQIIM